MSESVQHDEQGSSLHDRWCLRYDKQCSSLHAEGLNCVKDNIKVREIVDYIEVAMDRSQWLDFVNAVIIHWILKQLGMNNTLTVTLYTTWLVNIECLRVMQWILISREEMCYKLLRGMNMTFG